MARTIAYFLGTHEDWGGASRALLNFIRSIDKARFHPLVILTKEGNLSKSLTKEGIDWVVRKKHDRTNVVRYFAHIIDTFKFLRRRKIDMVHVNFGSLDWKPAEVLAARFARIPIISHIHIATEDPCPYLRYSAAIVCVSEYVAKVSKTYNVPTHAIYNISYMERFSAGTDLRNDFGFTQEHILVVFMGQMIRAKGIELLISAFRLISNSNARLLLAGGIRQTKDAYSAEEIETMTSSDPRVRYIGFRTDAENVYATADIMVMPSQWEEPCAMIIFEAAAAGKPLVATATGGTPEVLRHGETGFLVERSNVNELAQRLQMLIDDSALRRKLGMNARRIAAEEYSHVPVTRMESLYDSL